MIVTGTAARKKTAARSSEERISSAIPTTIVTDVVTSMIMPKAIQRRMMLMSPIIRESSCPDPHPSWKATGMFCTFA